MNAAGSTGSFKVHLEGENEPPTLLTSVKPTKRKDTFLISIIHPNTKEVLYSKEHRVGTLDEALKKAREIKDLPEMRAQKTEVYQILHYAKRKKGKFKMKTKDNQDGEYLDTPAPKTKKKASKKVSKKKKVVKKVIKKKVVKKKVKAKKKKVIKKVAKRKKKK